MTWRERAACRGVDSDVFFLTRGKGSLINLALAFCEGCEVSFDCLAWVMAGPSQLRDTGVWGGTTPADRRRMIQRAA